MIIRAFLDEHFRTYKLVNGYLLMVRPVENYARNWYTKGYSKWYCARRGVTVLARRIRSALNWCWNSLINLLIFPMVNLLEEINCKESNISIKSRCNCMSCLKLIVTNTLNFHHSRRVNLCYQGRMPFLNMFNTSLEF